jgi:hypothetical protein
MIEASLLDIGVIDRAALLRNSCTPDQLCSQSHLMRA